MDSELFDILDKNGRPTGQTCTRREAHNNGIFHRTVHMWLVKPDGRVLLQKRSRTKDCNPGCYDISSAGHILAGTGYIEGAVRELAEELGVAAGRDDFAKIGQIEKTVSLDISGKPFIDHETAAIFVYTGDFETHRLTLQAEEVESVMLMPIDDILSKISGEEADDFPNCLDLGELAMLQKYIDERRERKQS